jgi:hypothetical protein
VSRVADAEYDLIVMGGGTAGVQRQEIERRAA